MKSITATGRGLLAMGVCCLAAGAALGYAPLLTLAAGVLCLAAVSACMMVLTPSLRVLREVTPTCTTVGEPVDGRLVIHNIGRRPSGPFVAVERVGDEAIDLEVPSIRAGEHRAVKYVVPAPRRGRIRLGPLTVERRDPFGLFRPARRQTTDGILWVYPRVHPMRSLPAGVVIDHDGRINEHSRSGIVTFSALRDYVRGDDPRRIHWPSTARLGTLVVREHVDTTEPATTTVILDTRSEVYTVDSFEQAVETTASLVRAVEQAGRRMALRLPDEPAHETLDPLDRLALVAWDETTDLAGLLSVVDASPSDGALILVTGRTDDTLMSRLGRSRHGPQAIVMIALAEGAPTEARRLSSLTILTSATAREAVTTWNRMIDGGAP